MASSNACLAMEQGLLEAYVAEVGRAPRSATRAATLAAAACELLRGHASLGDHAVGLGYAERLLSLLAARLEAAGAGAEVSRAVVVGVWPTHALASSLWSRCVAVAAGQGPPESRRCRCNAALEWPTQARLEPTVCLCSIISIHARACAFEIKWS